VEEPERAPGLFVVLEGPDGAGKSAAARSLVRSLREAGHDVTATREPGGTAIGEALREVLLRAGAVERSGLADALLFSAARAELVEEVIRPALARGEIVVSDRYATSTTAYQGYGSGVPLDQLLLLERVATGGLPPDLVVLIDVPVEAGLARRGAAAGGETRFEEAFDRQFHERVRAGYHAMAAADPARWRIVDGTRSEVEVAGEVLGLVRRRLEVADQVREPDHAAVRITR
jgi:dTMP kinase